MEGGKLLILLAVLAVGVSVIDAGFTYYSIANLASKISGLATSSGDINLTIPSSANINFTTALLNWSNGQVDTSASFAILNTAAGTVTDGNWSVISGGFIIENIGTTNVTLDLAVGKTPANFIGGTSPFYMMNVSNNEENSCLNSTYDAPYGAENATYFGKFNHTTTSAIRICDYFDSKAELDTIEIDINLTIPSDSLTGALTDVLTATATA